MTHEELAARVEAAEGPSRDLDMQIALACFSESDAAAQGWFHTLKQMRNRLSVVPAYTASIDAALTLVPEGMDWERRHPNEWKVFGDDKDGFYRYGTSEGAATPAQGLCAAALRAKGGA